MVPALRVTLLLALALSACATPPPPPPEPKVDVRAELRRYGEWLVVAPWGRVWHPNASVVGDDFAPYLTGGGWVRGAGGWVFESKWPWGKFVFQAGRWFMADDLGWLWMPDETPVPPQVQWHSGDGFVGWSPLPPEVRGARHQAPPWFYVKERYFSARELQPYAVKPADVAKVHAGAAPMATAGPDVEALKAVGGLDRDPPLPEAPPPAVQEAPPPEAAPAAEEPPPPPKKKAAKKKRK